MIKLTRDGTPVHCTGFHLYPELLRTRHSTPRLVHPTFPRIMSSTCQAHRKGGFPCIDLIDTYLPKGRHVGGMKNPACSLIRQTRLFWKLPSPKAKPVQLRPLPLARQNAAGWDFSQHRLGDSPPSQTGMGRLLPFHQQ